MMELCGIRREQSPCRKGRVNFCPEQRYWNQSSQIHFF